MKGRYEDKIYGILAAGDVPLLPAGYFMSVRLDSSLAKRASKKPITESGIGAMIDRFGKLVEAQERGDVTPGRLKILDKPLRGDYDQPLVLVRETIPPGTDPDLPGGGSRLIGFHRTLHLPVLAIVHNEIGQEVDYYRFDRLEIAAGLDDRDFDPNQMARCVGRTSADR